jgi:hypothetical protein
MEKIHEELKNEFPWKEPTKLEIDGIQRKPEKDRNLESILQKDLRDEQKTFRELQIRTKYKEEWWDSCTPKDNLYVSYTTFGPDEKKYLVKCPRVGFKIWAFGPSKEYLDGFMKYTVNKKNPYIDFMRYRIKTITGILQIDSEWDGSSLEDPINKELQQTMENFLNDEMGNFQSAQTAKERGVAENSKQRVALKEFEKKMRNHKNDIFSNQEVHKNWFLENIKETPMRTKEELELLDVVKTFKSGKEEDLIKSLPTLTYNQVSIFLEKEKLTNIQNPPEIEFREERRKLSDGRYLLVRTTLITT